MKQLTAEAKARFFAQYWGQEILCCEGLLITVSEPVLGFRLDSVAENDIRKHNPYLLLTPLSLISDEDAIEVADIMALKSDTYFKKENKTRVSWVKDFLNNGSFLYYGGKSMQLIASYHYLQSRGYALRYYCPELKRVLTVEEMVEAGWIKLKEAEK